ncbi:hypothetical protein AURDEDRAFT_173621 [Auricularia subglabra TFB-10046 SS5]|uniref:FAD/NAD(P)-binding domain-containing protein n=1 Tax=Auricularia subglabra (strain TFB-10046 / SS5) TaxID=717982 RepID=J0DAM2_AURST|nr:hypothetical protein AURDEDRAFT_173621 [Auricularia subglabra TFB-10046 SS5]
MLVKRHYSWDASRMPSSVRTFTYNSKTPTNKLIADVPIGGLFAARICADHFEKVIVVEPEAWTFTDEARQPANFDTREVKTSTGIYNTWNHKRSRVYQYSAVHFYQALLLRFARRLFPGFDSIAKSWGDLIRPLDVTLCLSGHLMRPHSYVETIIAPRRNIEPLIRKVVLEGTPEIEIIHGTVTRYQLSSDGSVNVVNVRLGNGENKDFSNCALAVDCTGIAQSGVKLLSRVIPTFPSDLRQTYTADIVYSTLEYPVPPHFDEDLRKLNVPGMEVDGMKSGVLTFSASPDIDNRLASLLRCDANRVVFTMGGWAVDMPVNLQEIREFVKGIKNQNHVPDYFYKVLDLLEPVQHLGTVYEARVANCYKVDYARAAKVLPRNFVALGDSSMRVNPRFGQGVSKCAMGAICLDSVLRQMPPSNRAFSKSFFEKLTTRTTAVWDSTRLSDYAAPGTNPIPGETHETGRLMRWYNDQLIKHVENDRDLAQTLHHVQNFLAPSTDMLSPAIVARVLWGAFTGKA